jgi:signal transduction histidine kinase
VGKGLPAGAPTEATAGQGKESHPARLAEAVNDLVAKLRSAGPAGPDFRATMSHELRTPLTSIAGYVEMLRDGQVGPLTPAQAAVLEAVDRNTVRLRHAIEDVLALSKIESGTFRTAREPVSLTEVAAAAVEALRPVAAAQGIALRLHSPGRPVTVAGDPGQLGRLVINLLSNAVTFTPGGGRITVGVEGHRAVATLTVRDTGIGIPAGQQAPVGRPFRDVGAAGEPVPGSGLELVMARTIAANHGGELSVRSSEGGGTTVTVRIPLLVAEGARKPAAKEHRGADPGQITG